ncbi:MAG TPA: protein translocase subunit SecD [Streptosporangiaceae bacterium]|nr:protein translocase subunit SecD [Streptosporangiaceae bacterium]
MTSPSKPSRPRSSWPGGSTNSRQSSGPPSRPGIHLASLAAIIVIMFATIIGGLILHPGEWHDKFKIGLGLDLHGGTQVTLKAVAAHGGVPSKSDMTEAISILQNRVNGLGINNTSVVQQGNQLINISIPGASVGQVAPLLKSAQLRFRQVLLCTSESTTQCAQVGVKAGKGLPPSAPTTVPSPVPTTLPTPSASPSGSSSPKASSSPQASSSPKPSSSKSGGNGQAAGAKPLAKASTSPSPSPSASSKASPSPSASSKASSSPSASSSPTPTGSPTPTPSASPSSPLIVTGDQSKVTPAALALFKKLSCKDAKWQLTIYKGKSYEYNGQSQIVACDGQGVKYVLGPPIVLGQDLRSPKAQLDPTNNQYVVTFNLDGKASKAFGAQSTAMYNAYYNAQTQSQTSVLDQFAIVLDGRVVSAPTIQQPITGGSGQITGNFTQKSSTDLANVLKYGALPLSFSNQTVQSVSAQLGSEQLDAGLIAAAIGMLLVILYSVFYYRGLALVSVFSLATAALLSWLAVILLTKFQGYSLTLAGVAGLIVAIGITADSFIIYFERLRDEVREGRSLRAAVERGWGRARRTVLVSDTVSFLAALLLYIFAIGDVKGFAFTLGLTTLIDIVVVFLFTKPMVTLLARLKFYSSGRPMSGLDPTRLGAKSPWRGSRPAAAKPATGGAAASARTTPKEA